MSERDRVESAYREHSLTNHGVVYDVRKVIYLEAQGMIDKIETKRVISGLALEDRGYFSLVMFLRKNGGGDYRKVMDFCLLNAYYRT